MLEHSKTEDYLESLNPGKRDEVVSELHRIAVTTHLTTLGYNLDSASLVETPNRVVRTYWDELNRSDTPSDASLQEMLVSFDEGDYTSEYDTIVAMSNISFRSWCEHHVLPFWGKFYIAYLPAERVVGLSKLVRLVTSVTKGLTLQERATHKVNEFLAKALSPRGTLVVSEAVHSCMIARGVKGTDELVRCSAVSGLMKESSTARDEALRMLGF